MVLLVYCLFFEKELRVGAGERGGDDLEGLERWKEYNQAIFKVKHCFK